ncbi:hypothetical protein N7499_000345 [Penicillium canescens]|uniref:Uncharacterized protein n=1 Tax=Penicillium canescens TaxID=5083 RepID=A0AAD6NAN9_PENCN|nr:uncharacterized protein N7446_011455 [Penicillium canescens]KAJ6004276.1 hypothetical protein N7522_005921 [Penicillium canescens]KAJ6029200.1 hypothetical protein N7444_012187 [Penicillium canescens]KAJ6047631.1 hypothetical protein N7460_003778 [Penicillium canescens]KAJ6048772.1 hypothetical protein N7446_011455 [Penicillium canescens]KAJ6100715.1 hypothetical protein N7499_000345 [Penicillium canescens]
MVCCTLNCFGHCLHRRRRRTRANPNPGNDIELTPMPSNVSTQAGRGRAANTRRSSTARIRAAFARLTHQSRAQSVHQEEEGEAPQEEPAEQIEEVEQGPAGRDDRAKHRLPRRSRRSQNKGPFATIVQPPHLGIDGEIFSYPVRRASKADPKADLKQEAFGGGDGSGSPKEGENRSGSASRFPSPLKKRGASEGVEVGGPSVKRRRSNEETEAEPSGSGSGSGSVSWGSFEEITEELVDGFLAKGTNYQDWIQFPNDEDCAAPCPVPMSILTTDIMLNTPDPADRWEVRENGWIDRPLELHDTHQIDLPTNPGTYHRLHVSKLGTGEERRQKWNEYKGRTTLGAIFAEDNTRVDGPHWNELAKAHYEANYDINSLKFVFRLNVVNRMTMPYVDSVLYPRFGLDLMQDQTVRNWAYNTDEYKEILGTALGKGVGALILSAFPRGTRRITQILTWTHQEDLQIRFIGKRKIVAVLWDMPIFDKYSPVGFDRETGKDLQT